MTMRSDRRHERWARVVLLGAALVLGAAAVANAACEVQGVDADGIANARDAIAAACRCHGAATHTAYVACATDVVNDRIAQSLLPASCRQSVLGCARQSTCGRPGAVTCFRSRLGNTRCRIEPNAAACVAPRNGSVCGGDLIESCCDACPIAACMPTPTPIPTPVPSPTPTPPPTPSECDPGAHPLCSPAPCPTPGGGLCSGCHYVCPLECCPNGCGLICVTPTPVAP